jgi:hypothetical protein
MRRDAESRCRLNARCRASSACHEPLFADAYAGAAVPYAAAYSESAERVEEAIPPVTQAQPQ